MAWRSAVVLASLGTAAWTATGQPAPTAPEGFVALFNGVDLTGWKGLVADPPSRARMSAQELESAQATADHRMRDHWRVEEGVLVFDGGGDSLCTAGDYGDFELFVDWKIEPGGDSGVYLRGAPQVQIWDNPVGSGGLYNNEKHASRPLIKADRAVGEWNTFRILMVRDRVTVYLNGLLVVDDTVLENYWERDRPIYPRGQIELQNHGNTLRFRNIFVRELPESPAPAPGPIVKPGSVVAIVGDSITEQRLYSRMIETYLLACQPQLRARVVQLGWGGERAPGFAARMENDLIPFTPDIVTTCYGMNDGLYRAYEPGIGAAYREAMTDIVRRCAAAGATVVVGSPGAVDFDTFHNGTTPAVYNANLGHLRDIARDLARESGQPFANVHDHMVLAMTRAKPALGPAYHVCGGDGFHPSPNGHLVMAYAFLRALGLDGDLGTITIDMKGGASASGGHTVTGSGAAGAEIESARYPFCFFGEEASPDGTRSMLPFVPFNDDLNRFRLIVRNLDAPAATVGWSGEGGFVRSKRFTREQLAAGINLAAEFPENPFSRAFERVDQAVAEKQAFETRAIKEAINAIPRLRGICPDDPTYAGALEALRSRLLAREAELQQAVAGAVVPVRHWFAVTPEG